MANLEKIKSIMSLNEEELNFERNLYRVRAALDNEKRSCNHLEVKLGEEMGEVYNCCLICGARDIMPTENSVDATKYLPEYDVINDSEFTEKFHIIQTMACGILNNHNERNVENSVLASELNNLIESAIKEEAKKLVK